MQFVTSMPGDSTFYFTRPGFTPDDEAFLFSRSAPGQEGVYLKHLSTGEEEKMPGGLIDPGTRTCIRIEERRVYRQDRDGTTELLFEYPPAHHISGMHLNADATKLVCALNDDRVRETYDGTNNVEIDRHAHAIDCHAYICVYDIYTAERLVYERIPECAWVTHIQFCPVNDDLILYNHEWCDDCGIRRLWLFDGKRHIRLRTEGEGRSRADWTCHEMFEPHTSNIIYHGRYEPSGIHYIGRIVIPDPRKPDVWSLTEIPFPANYTYYGHFAVANDHLLVTDGCYRAADDEDSIHGKWISLLHVDWASREIRWEPLERHHSDWVSHPHPAFNNRGDFVLYTGVVNGETRVCGISLPAQS